MRCGRGRRVLVPSSLSPHVCVLPCAAWAPAAPLCRWEKQVEAVIKALLDAYPDAAKAKDNVRCGRGRRVLCPLLSHSSHMRSMPSPPPFSLSPLCKWERCQRPRDNTVAIKALLAV